MRSAGGIEFINNAVKNLAKTHIEDMKFYGDDNDQRMTGKHETSDIKTFTHGVGNRGSSVRISKSVFHEGKGYFEDRRPASNLDPYKVLQRIMASVLDVDA